MELRNYQLGDETKIIELFELVFKQKMSMNQWMWRFRNNPAGQHMIKLMWDNDKLVGHYAVSPVIMNVNRTDVLTAHSLTTMTHPDYGGRGIFKTLSLALYDDLENTFGCKAIWGYPNNNSHFGFINSLGWSNIAVLHTLGIEADKINSSSNELKVSTLNCFDDTHANYIDSKIKNSFDVFIKRSVDYLNWRYVEKPAVSYKKYFIESQSGKGVLVTKIYPSKKNNYFDLNIVECHLDDYSKIHDIIHFIMTEYGHSFDRVTLWKNLFDKDHLLLEKNGFVPVVPQTYLGARIHSSMDAKFSQLKNWYVSMGDSDVF